MQDRTLPTEHAVSPQHIAVDVCEAEKRQPSVERALDFVSDAGFGGIAVFVGKIRDANVGREVVGISYDMFAPLARNLFRSFAEEVSAEFGPRVRLFVEHAKGRLGVGDIAVVVAAGTPHRDEAFRACRALIEAVKHRAPIWKQEHYVDGSSVWSEGCSLCETSREHDATLQHHREHGHPHEHDSTQAHGHVHAHPHGGA